MSVILNFQVLVQIRLEWQVNPNPAHMLYQEYNGTMHEGYDTYINKDLFLPMKH